MDLLADDLGLQRSALIARLKRERERHEMQSTEALGGWTKIGVQIERLLRAQLSAVGTRCGRTPGDLFCSVARDGWTLERASAGQILHVWRVVDPIGSASLAPAISRLIERRNLVVHGRGPIDPSARADIEDAIIALTREEP